MPAVRTGAPKSAQSSPWCPKGHKTAHLISATSLPHALHSPRRKPRPRVLRLGWGWGGSQSSRKNQLEMTLVLSMVLSSVLLPVLSLRAACGIFTFRVASCIPAFSISQVYSHFIIGTYLKTPLLMHTLNFTRKSQCSFSKICMGTGSSGGGNRLILSLYMSLSSWLTVNKPRCS